MKIVHVAEPFAGGIVAFLKSLAENLPDDMHIIIHGERASVMSIPEAKNQLRNCQVRFIHWRSAQRSIHPRKDTAAFIELYTILKRLKKRKLVDAVHLHSSKSGFIGRIVCRLLNMPTVIYTPNGAPFLVGTSKLSNFLYRQLERFAFSFGGQVVCCSPSEQAEYKKVGIPAITINNGINFDNNSSPADKPSKKFCIVTSGRILHQKNPSLFNSIAGYFEEFPHFKFVWIGDGPQRELLTASNIIVTGWQPREDVASLISNASIYISTAQFEGLPFAVLEALALKKPVLLTDSVGNRDLVKNCLNGDLFKHSSQAIVKVLQYANNASMLNVMGQYSMQYGREYFNANNTSTRYRKLYQGLYSQESL
ncbi:MAG: glycosyltransferase [Candidatus Pseudobacter hemicellulosilyticus]|uniref:Glycosyltransferase n=1 Tax=Candidatus Pseudobacter hemicellulosilyticus TaxID=3121375 RepID=A0AAJ5WVZ8_9BACT|nr:MAG: glycosyltransferase [Pseudobacter sp.]